MALIIPGNLVLKNGGVATSTSQSFDKSIYKEGADIIVDGTRLDVDGEIIIGGRLVCADDK